jgi:hypothetical protein
MMRYIGIDPGSSSGNIAIITRCTYSVFKFKDTTLRDMFEYLNLYKDNSIAILEKVWGVPGMSVKAVSSFIKNVGHIEAMLTAVSIPWEEQTPSSWMKHFGMKKDKNETKPQWKSRLRELAERRMPEAPINRENADAFLIALYCKQTNDGS